MTSIGMIGLGNFGTAIAHLLTSNGHSVLGWDVQASVLQDIQQTQCNQQYLPQVTLHPTLQVTDDLQMLLAHVEMLFIAIPARYIRPTLQNHLDTVTTGTICVNMAKGLDTQTNETAFTILQKLLPQCRHLVLSGPSIANEFVQGHRTRVVIAGTQDAYQQVADKLDSPIFRTDYSSDTIATEWGGILKNIYSIGLGLLPEPLGVNTQALYLNDALAEMGTIFELLGSERNAIYSLSGMGDFLATALSEHSHNRGFGESVRHNPTYLTQALAGGHLLEPVL
ncbi:MAG: NAD(P)-binding domain-containing protein, partial [Chloroflexota bacterium]